MSSRSQTSHHHTPTNKKRFSSSVKPKQKQKLAKKRTDFIHCSYLDRSTQELCPPGGVSVILGPGSDPCWGWEGEGDDDTKVNKWRSVPLVDTCTEVITCVTSNHGLQFHLTPWAHSTPSAEFFCCHTCDQFLRQTICCVCFVCPSSQLPFHTD